MEMFQLDFIQRAFLAGFVISIICPLTGIFLVLRGMSLIGSALSHLSMAGIALALMGGFSPTAGATVICMAGSLAVEYLRTNFKKYADLAIAVIMSAGMGLAILLISAGNLNNSTVISYLFGSIVTTTSSDVILIFSVGLLVTLAVIKFYHRLFYITFDEEGARYAGINTRVINTLFILLSGLTVAVSIRIVGILLVSPLMTIPVATALQLAKSFKSAASLSVVFSFISVTGGIIASYYLNLAPGGTIIIIALGLLLFSISFNKIRRNFI